MLMPCKMQSLDSQLLPPHLQRKKTFLLLDVDARIEGPNENQELPLPPSMGLLCKGRGKHQQCHLVQAGTRRRALGRRTGLPGGRGAQRVELRPHRATLEACSMRGAHPTVALPFPKTSGRVALQEADRQPGPGTCLSGSYLGMPGAGTWCGAEFTVPLPFREESFLSRGKLSWGVAPPWGEPLFPANS